MVRKLLSVGRKTPESRKPIRICTIIKESLDLLRRTIPTTIDIKESNPVRLRQFWVMLTEINQVVINLCTNSVHAMTEECGILEVGLDTIKLNRSQHFVMRI